MSATIPIRRGATLVLPLDFFSDAAETVPLNLTGSTLAIVDSTFPVAPTLTVLNAVNGSTELRLSATNTSNLVKRRAYVHSIKHTQANGDIKIYGPFNYVASNE